MKILQSSIFRAICAIAIGILLIKYTDDTVTWITVAIGVLFLLSGIISLVVYYNALKHAGEYKITDVEGNVIAGEKPTFPVVGVGSAILGLMLALKPTIFITALMYIIGGILVLGAVNQFMNLLNARRFGRVGFGFWIFPSLILLMGLYVIIYPMASASVPVEILGWCTLLYGVTEVINSIKIYSEKRKAASAAKEIPSAEEVASYPNKEASYAEEMPSSDDKVASYSDEEHLPILPE